MKMLLKVTGATLLTSDTTGKSALKVDGVDISGVTRSVFCSKMYQDRGLPTVGTVISADVTHRIAGTEYSYTDRKTGKTVKGTTSATGDWAEDLLPSDSREFDLQRKLNVLEGTSEELQRAVAIMLQER